MARDVQFSWIKTETTPLYFSTQHIKNVADKEIGHRRLQKMCKFFKEMEEDILTKKSKNSIFREPIFYILGNDTVSFVIVSFTNKLRVQVYLANC